VIFFLHSKYVNLHRSTKELVLNPFFFLHFIISKTRYLLLYIDYLFVFGFLVFLYFIISFFFLLLYCQAKLFAVQIIFYVIIKRKKKQKKTKQRQAQSYILQRKETINVVTSIRIHKHKNSVRSTRPNEEEKSNEERKKQRQR
jgi:ABC-type bacteriocin/lantibiotic exporter with double-glycine peptidase domain